MGYARPGEVGMRRMRALVLTGSSVGLGGLARTHAGVLSQSRVATSDR